MPAVRSPAEPADGSVRPDRSSPTFERDVQRMFATIADRYDAFNHLATFGLDLLWRPRAVWELRRFGRGPVDRVLDLGCGTGGLGRTIAAEFPRARVVAVDFTPAMVREARHRTVRGSSRFDHGIATALRLPFRDAAFDVVANAFVARNLLDLGTAFAEARRVLRPEGTLLTLEVAEPASPAVARLFHAHFDHAVPLLGRAFDREGPYSYLPRSLRSLPPPERLVELLGNAGFSTTRRIPMSLGIVAAYLSRAGATA